MKLDKDTLQGLIFLAGMSIGIIGTSISKSPTEVKTRIEAITIDKDCSIPVKTAHVEDEVKIKVKKLDPTIKKPFLDEFSSSVANISVSENIDPNILLAIAYTESRFNPDIRGRAGEYGLFQVMPGWADELAFVKSQEDLGDITVNTTAGGTIYKKYLTEFHGNTKLALLAYNRGPASVLSDLRAGIDPNNGYADTVMSSYYNIRRY